MNEHVFVHGLSPIAFTLFDIQFPWYWIAYALGFLIVMFASERSVRRDPTLPLKHHYDLLMIGWVGVFVGGRVGYVFFYNLEYYRTYPGQILQIWNGGMSFHGAVLGIALTTGLYSFFKSIPVLRFWDHVLVPAPFALMLGRIANFINGELAGTKTQAPWGVVFPHLGPSPRHPSQLYEAIGEGPLLFLFLLIVRRIWSFSGAIAASFVFGYGLIRFSIGFFRLPDPQVGYLLLGFTLGQWLCLSMVVIGLILFLAFKRRKMEKNGYHQAKTES